MRLTCALVAGACVAAIATASAQSVTETALSPAAYAAELERLADRVATPDAARSDTIGAAIDALPSEWRVQSGDQIIHVSSYWLRQDLREIQQHSTDAARVTLARHLRFLSVQASAADTAASAPPGARSTLAAILLQKEFSGIGETSWTDRLIRRVAALLLRILRVSVTSSGLAMVTNALVYVLIGAGVLLLAFVMYRALRRAARIEALHIESPDAPPAVVAFEDARAAATRGAWREAINLAYWWGIQTLEARGTWRPDRARTPREYLRLLPAGSAQAQPLTSLTRLIERVWYAGDPANAAEFDEAVAHLKQLGCLHG